MLENAKQCLPKKYVILGELGHGAFGMVLQGINTITHEGVAIKVESRKSEYLSLKREAQLYKIFASVDGVPNVKWFGCTENLYFLVIPLLGDTLENRISNGSPIDASIVKTQMMSCVKHIHTLGYLHRDLKPENFLFDKDNNLKLVDFGLCKKFRNDDGSHIPLKTGKSIIGTPNFISLNIHNGYEPSRRDDVESILYILCYIEIGALPWTQSNIHDIYVKKMQIVFDFILCEQLRDAIMSIRRVEFEHVPNYF